MKLLFEVNETDNECVVESTQGMAKNYYIQGRWATANESNKNGRMYPGTVMESAVNKYVNEFVSQKRALSELGHPQGPTVNLDRVSHMIESLKMEGNYVTGRGKLLDTPMGKIAKSLVDEGVKLGVSTRGLGSLVERRGFKEVQPDFFISAIDIVADPSGPGCFVNSVMEGSDWVMDAAGNWIAAVKQEIEEAVVSTTFDRTEREVKFAAAFQKFLKNI